MNHWLDQLRGAAPEGLYVHVPFCRRRCAYCDFHSNVLDEGSKGRAGPAVDAILAELAFWRSRLDLSALRTAFIGGGTPTVLPRDALARLIETIGAVAGRTEEFTIEANPATVDHSLARDLAAGGVNRISFGAQSLDDGELRLLGRIHSAADVGRSVEIARRAGLGNVNLDLIFGIPGQTRASWRRTLDGAVALGVEHLSCYGLTYEHGTPLAQRVRDGEVQPLDDDLTVEMYRLAQATLASAGFEQYEISNWAKPARQCRHNLLYWENRPWLGVGPSAASYLAGWRFKSPADVDGYVAAWSGGQPRFEDVEKLSASAAAGEAAMLALRTRAGIEPEEFRRRYGLDVRQLPDDPVGRHVGLGTLVWSGGRWRISESALPVADSVLVDFVVTDRSAKC